MRPRDRDDPEGARQRHPSALTQRRRRRIAWLLMSARTLETRAGAGAVTISPELARELATVCRKQAARLEATLPVGAIPAAPTHGGNVPHGSVGQLFRPLP